MTGGRGRKGQTDAVEVLFDENRRSREQHGPTINKLCRVAVVVRMGMALWEGVKGSEKGSVHAGDGGEGLEEEVVGVES